MSAVTIKGVTFPLSFDCADDAPPEWTWEGKIPLCPTCLVKGNAVPLIQHGRDTQRLAPVEVLAFGEPSVVCECCQFSAAVQR